MHTHTNTHTRTHMNTYTHSQTYAHTHTHTHTHTRMKPAWDNTMVSCTHMYHLQPLGLINVAGVLKLHVDQRHRLALVHHCTTWCLIQLQVHIWDSWLAEFAVAGRMFSCHYQPAMAGCFPMLCCMRCSTTLARVMKRPLGNMCIFTSLASYPQLLPT